MIETSKKKHQQILDTPLAHAFHFGMADLQDNQQGFISRKQRQHLIGVTIATSILIGVLVVIAIIFLISQVLGTQPGWGLLGVVIIAILVLGFVGGLTAVAGLRWQEVLHDVRANRVQSITGRVRSSSYKPHEKSAKYYITIGEETLSVTEQQQQAFETDSTYQLYIAPHARVILSAEVINENDSG